MIKSNRAVRQNVLPVLAAMIWGLAFLFQKQATDYLGAFTFNALRGAVAFVSLLLVMLTFRLVQRRATAQQTARGSVTEQQPHSRRMLWLGGLCCGSAMSIASNLQQLGLSDTSAGKAGFITALYIILVPLFGLFIGKRVGVTVWGGVALAAAGLYFLCIHGTIQLTKGDALLLLCAACFSVHILLIDYFTKYVDGLTLSCAQFLFFTVESALGAVLLREVVTPQAIRACLTSVLYLGILSSGVGYTLQILAQKGSNPAVVSLLLSLESVFSVVADALLAHTWMKSYEWIGCALMLLAVVLVQLPIDRWIEKRKQKA